MKSKNASPCGIAILCVTRFILVEELIGPHQVVAEARRSAEINRAAAKALAHLVDGNRKLSLAARYGSTLVDLAEQIRLNVAIAPEIAHADTEQPNMHSFRPDLVHKRASDGDEDVLVVGGMRQTALDRAAIAVRILDLYRNRATRQPAPA